MPVIVAKYAGFCSGVSRAVNVAQSLAKEHGKINSLGELVHNSSVVSRLEDLGVVAGTLDTIITPSVIIRSHGVAPNVLKSLQNKEIQIFDLTCPFVSRLHENVAKYSADGLPVILVGDANHPEIVGTIGWCKGKSYTVNTVCEAEQLPLLERALAVAQTTFPYELWQKICDVLKSRVKRLDIMDTICTATIKRQDAAKELAKIADAMIVIGGKNSSNTKKLYDTCKRFATEQFW